MKTKFRLKVTDDTMDIYEWEVNENYIINVYHYKGFKNSVKFEASEFILREDQTWEAQKAETNKFVRHSCHYGHWQVENIELEKEMLEFGLSLIQKENRNQTLNGGDYNNDGTKQET